MRKGVRVGLALALSATLSGCDDVVGLPEGTRFVSVTAGASHTCALDEAGQAWCWGANDRGQLGVGHRGRSEPSPVAVSGGVRFRALSAGHRHTCGIDEQARAWCWGANGSGQIGDGSWDDRDRPVLLPEIRVRAIAGGASHSCALDERDRVVCWGSNVWGELGVAGASALNRPVVVAPSVQVEASGVTAGSGHSCATLQGGAICWGANERLQLGATTTLDTSIPVRVSTPELLIRVVAGAAHSCALSTRQQVLCWGDNSLGQVGRSPSAPTGSPVVVPVPQRVFLLDSRGNQACAAAEQYVWCWGELRDDRLGSVATRPTEYLGLAGAVTSLGVGEHHACAVVGGHAYCWGWGEAGQLGDGRSQSYHSGAVRVN